MYNHLVDHALRNVWCSPRQDMQAIVQPARLTPEGGAWNSFQVQWNFVRLPRKNTRFHVFQIGQLHPSLMGLFDVQNTWVSLAEACVSMRLITDIYNVSGVQMPRYETWYMVTKDKNLILAIKHQKEIPFHCGKEDVFMRVYTNAYFASSRAEGTALDIWVVGAKPTTRPQILQLQNEYEKYLRKPGLAYGFVNGMAVSKIDLLTVQTGDIVEFVYDASVYKTIEFKVRDLQTFRSTLDDKHKYLLHYPGKGLSIDYHDDLDLFLMRDEAAGRRKGVYYHRNAPDAVRMVTHKDYSTPVDYLIGYAGDLSGWSNPEDMTLVVHVRKGGWERELVFEHNRIHELYKLPDREVVGAMLGVNSTVDNWKAAVLEDSSYTAMMRSLDMRFTSEQVENAYGYNACSKVIADTPSRMRLSSGMQVADVPYGLRSASTGYEYDADGKLLGFNTHIEGTLYPTRYSKTQYVEFINAYADDRLDETYGATKVGLDESASYRFYICDMIGGKPSNNWRDVTGGPEYSIVGNYAHWLVDTTNFYTLVRSDVVVLTYKQTIRAKDGVIKFPIKHRAHRNNETTYWDMQIPMGELDIWLNGYELIEGLDYIVKFPEVVITNKRHLFKVTTNPQEVIIRFSGFCDKQMRRNTDRDVGFINYGMLSRNNRFDIRDDKVLHISAGGKFRHRDDLIFSEDHPGIELRDVKNGDPYIVRDIVVPMRRLLEDNTYEMRERSKAVDKKVSEYLTSRIPDQDFDNANSIAERYAIVSPFCCKLMWDLKNGLLHDERLTQHYNDNVVRELCEYYEYLLDFDPCLDKNKVDDRYVVIHPHNLTTVVAIDIYHLRFLSRAVKLYLGDKVELSNHIRIYEPEEQ